MYVITLRFDGCTIGWYTGGVRAWSPNREAALLFPERDKADRAAEGLRNLSPENACRIEVDPVICARCGILKTSGHMCDSCGENV